MPQLDSDAFPYSDGNLATVSGGKWTKLSGFNDLIVTSNQLQWSAGGGNDKADEITTWSGSLTNQWSQVEARTTDVAFAGPTVHSNGVSSFYLFEFNINGTQCDIQYVNAGAYTAIATFTGQLAIGDIGYLEWVAGVLTAKINGVTVGSVSHSTLASGKPGVRIYDSGTARALDNWAAGDFSAAGHPTLYYAQLRRQ